MKNFKQKALAAATLLALSAGSAQAATYHLNTTNNASLPEADFITVDITEINNTGTDVDVQFEVTVNNDSFLPNANSTLGNNFGMDFFYFNYDTSLSINIPGNFDLINPDDWRVREAKRDSVAGFGTFEIEFKGPGSRVEGNNSLIFVISGVTGDSASSYAIGHEGVGEAYFAAHVGGFNLDGAGEDDSAWVATVVPVPAAVWLFGSGLIGLAGIARRKQS